YANMIHRFLKNENPIKKAIKLFIPGRFVYRYGEFLREVNKTQQTHESINEDVKKFLIDFYKPQNAELEKMIGKDLSDWNK
ncbi:MAG: hypothetical protein L6Q66_08280, partial [Bacteroidia bacterium]|nr:hypothetical protein [Bacteroidia bacterium]